MSERFDSALDQESYWKNIMAKKGWYIQAADLNNPEDKSGILALIKSYYADADETFPEYYDWEYLNNPAGVPLILMAKAKNKIVGICVLNRISFKSGKAIITGGIFVKTITHKDYRNKGIHLCLLLKLMNIYRNRGIGLAFGLPNDQASRGVFKREIVRKLGSIPFLIRLLAIKKIAGQINSKSFLHCVVNKHTDFLFQFIDRVFGFKNSFICSLYKNKFKVCQIDSFDQRIDEFWDKVSGDHQNMLVRDKKFLNWRYYENPRRSYIILTAEDDKSQILSYIVFRVKHEKGVKSGFIVDMMAVNNRLGRQSCFYLINKALNMMRKAGVEVSGCLMLGNNIYYKMLKKYFFFRCPKSIYPRSFYLAMARFHNRRECEGCFDINNWYTTLGDYDLI